MPIPRERIAYLLDVYAHGGISPEEETELIRWIAFADDDSAFKEHIQRLIRDNFEENFSQVDWEALYNRIELKSGQLDPPVQVHRIKWYQVAAVLVLFLGVGALYKLSYKKPSFQSKILSNEASSKPIIKPGGVKAILQAGNLKINLGKEDTSFMFGGNKIQLQQGQLKTADIIPSEYILSTPRGGEYKLVLADGSQVWLNAGSTLQYPSVFRKDIREVNLEGEAYFKVHADANHPFIVHTPRQDIRVLGTEFNVHAYGDELKEITTLVFGVVKVKGGANEIQLKPGEQAQLTKSGQITLYPNPDIEQAIAWKNDYFRFDGEDIYAIMRQLARWYDIDVHFDEHLTPHYFGAVINRNNNISGILNMLEATGNVHFKINGRNITVTP